MPAVSDVVYKILALIEVESRALVTRDCKNRNERGGEADLWNRDKKF